MLNLRLTVVAALLVSALGLTVASAGLSDWIFGDSFESGNPLAWTQLFGTLQVVPAAASDGDFGLRAGAELGEAGWVQHDVDPAAEVFRADVELNADLLNLPTGNGFSVIVGWHEIDEVPAVAVGLGNDGGGLSLRLFAFDAGQFPSPVASQAVPLGEPGWHRIAVEFGSDTGGKAGGVARLFLDGAQVAELTDLDNSQVSISAVRLGFASGHDQEITGSIDLDVYTAVRLFDPWPCVLSSDNDPMTGQPVCLDGEARDTAIATGSCPDALVVWSGAEDLLAGGRDRARLGGIYGKRVSGASGRGLTTTFAIAAGDDAETPDVGVDGQCRAVVVWKAVPEVDAIAARVVGFDGTPLSNLIPVAMSGNTEAFPAVGVSAEGTFLVTWRREAQENQGIFARHFGSDGTPTDDEFAVDTDAGQVSKPAVASNALGESVIVWEADGMIRALLVDDAGQPVQFVPVTDGSSDGQPAVAVLEDGSFVVTWIRETSDIGVYLRRFDASGQPLAEVVRVDTLLPGNCAEPQVEVGIDERILVVWTSLHQGLRTLRGRVFEPGFAPGAGEFVIEDQGAVWLADRPRAAVAQRLLFSYSEVTDPGGFRRGGLVGALDEAAPGVFADGFDDGTTDSWSQVVP
jgi:hypothetical protein